MRKVWNKNVYIARRSDVSALRDWKQEEKDGEKNAGDRPALIGEFFIRICGTLTTDD